MTAGASGFARGGFTLEGYSRQICDQIGAALIVADRDLRIRVWNLAAGRMFGAAAEAMIGSPLLSVIPKERRAPAEKVLREALHSGECAEFEFEDHDAAGRLRELVGVIAAVAADDGERIGVSLCLRDITRRIALQNELHEGRKMRALGEMAGAVAHHFNNILGGVVTSVDYAKSETDQALQSRVLDRASAALLRAMSLVHGLLAFSRGDQRADDLADFTEIMNELADDVEELIAGKPISFVLNLPKLPVLPVARAQVFTALRNIAVNAIEAMPAGGSLRIEVSLDAERIAVSISDTGEGMDELAQSRLFQPFWSTKETVSPMTGTARGLGLAMAHGLMQVVGGSISVTSELGKGSCFQVSIPRPNG